MPIIEMHMMVGRTTEQKRRVMASVAQSVAEALDCSIHTVRILITEHQPDEFSVAGVSTAEKQEATKTTD